ncbi:MAG: hypothetical protein H6721_12315 [Sandaracinus sp.]|nr:hypothetical protein [Sandaracinus sp.]
MTRLLPFLFVLAACRPSGSGPAGPRTDPTPNPTACDPASEAPAPEPLHWRRHAAFVADVHAALALDASTGCRELDRAPCGDVHLVALGGNDVFGAGQYEPVARPLATTPLVVDRFVLGACSNRVTLDAEGTPVVFGSIDLAAPNVRRSAARETGADLYRRLLRRDARDAELDEIASLAEGLAARDFAIAACFAIGTSTEAVLY